MRSLTKVRLSRARLLLWARYSASSVVATVVSQVAFALCYWFGTPALVATLVAWIAGAVPNYVLNRRWTWGRGGQKLPYTIIVIGSAATAALVTSLTDHFVQPLESHAWKTVLVSGSYLATYAVLFIVKFWLFDRLVFAKPAVSADAAEARTPVAT
ncbi:GtrA family protein [Kribbella solani]|uniref:GtrA family protein n=1 Tax=Kribbella solani TaxID=236067 RepID=UPI0029AC2104|nr:GtrA family protein [Kribbella solani]MDX2972317.1 GtrA family protein [Kribbella solani]MDX3001194.1 GtrA family protein [Kribbella solani]